MVVDEMEDDEMEDLGGDVQKTSFGRADGCVRVGEDPKEIGKLRLEELRGVGFRFRIG